MRLHPSKEAANTRLATRIWLKLALIALVALPFVAIPQIFSARAGGAQKSPKGGVLFTVTTTNDHNDGVCDGGDCTLREAIQAANNAAGGDTIDFSVTGAINLTSALPDITDSVEITGPGANVLTVRRNTGGDYRIFNVTATGTVTFFNLSIINGKVEPGGGGGIQNFSAGIVNVIDSRVSGNFAATGNGGGVYNNSIGTVNVTNSTISGNLADEGGGILNNVAGTVNVTNSTISGNSGQYGGGIENRTGTLNVINSTISGNMSFLDGAGIFDNSNGAMNVSTSTITGNTAANGNGGGLNNGSSGGLNVTSCTISNNTAANGNGGGIYNGFAGTLNVTHSTISGNFAPDGPGGGIYNEGTGPVKVTNSTINGNSADEGGGILNNDTGIVNVTNSTISGNSGRFGGGIENRVGTVIVTNSTISGNSAASGEGGGIFNRDSGTVNVKSSIIAGNTASDSQDVSRIYASQGFNLIGKTDGSTGFTAPTDLTGTEASPLDPKLDPFGLQDNGGPTKTIALLCGSPGIDKGTSNGLTGALSFDQRGAAFPRTVDDLLAQNAPGGDGTDIGAFELPVCNHPPVAQCRNIQVSAGANCQASITAAQIDNGSFDPDPGDSIATRALDNSGPFGLGPHAVTLTVTDTHGASSSCMATVTVVDTTPPAITCPANITAKAQPGGSCVVVNFPAPQASDNCAVMTVSCTPPSGSCFPLGTTTVTCTATDTSGNTASCSFTVTTFDICLQDDADPFTVFLGNSSNGDYRFCCGGATFTGRAKVTRQGNVFTFERYGADRRVLARDDEGAFRGTASLQSPPGRTRCTIADRDTRNNSCTCE